ncbi:conjugal transfer protein [Apilactobacillus quenuiae]|uniref:conjugal transfer protein n=1 Tax=Apilactobacillus quenuiae TaxID=2008377 RepID=UPI000D0130C8|nr:conjugal transfer protein [Apilactobacillus quenuiae]
MLKKGKEFIFPENVNKDYGIWKDYTLRDIGYIVLVLLIGLIFILMPPYGIVFMLMKIILLMLLMTVTMAVLTIRPVASRKNIKVREVWLIQRKYAKRQKLFYLKPQKEVDIHASKTIYHG